MLRIWPFVATCSLGLMRLILLITNNLDFHVTSMFTQSVFLPVSETCLMRPWILEAIDKQEKKCGTVNIITTAVYYAFFREREICFFIVTRARCIAS